MSVKIHDVLIIGAGPAGLAVAAHLRESTPSSVFTDAEHDRYQWIKKHSGRMNLRPRQRDTERDATTSLEQDEMDIQVLDSSGSNWMVSWNKNFAALGISHLRSPMFFHPCPRDRDGLLAFAHETGRCGDCVEIANCVGKSMSKHRRKKRVTKRQSIGSSTKAVLEIDERDRKDYFTPSSDIFREYCDSVLRRYSLENLVERTRVTSIDFDQFDEVDLDNDDNPGAKVFKVMTVNGVAKFAKIVVLAIGAGGSPVMPRHLSAAEAEGACHSTQLQKQTFLARSVREKILARKPTAIVVVGGGLTAAQIADKCVRDGVGRVFMIMRSGVKLKPFDIDLDWMTKYKNVQKAAFWSADSDEERLEIMLEARNGGSITPRFFKKLRAHIASGALSIHTETTIKDQVWHNERKTWRIETGPSTPNIPGEVDYVYYATGVQPDVPTLPFLSPLREKVPTEVVGGMPCLTNDLAWKDDVPLFVAGRLAGLRIGPDCGNLEGARIGAERISWAVNEWLERHRKTHSNNDASYDTLCRRVGLVNMYESLEFRTFNGAAHKTYDRSQYSTSGLYYEDIGIAMATATATTTRHSPYSSLHSSYHQNAHKSEIAGQDAYGNEHPRANYGSNTASKYVKLLTFPLPAAPW
ncbi:MAG: hypothetical protein Q9218_004517 [Villophora microphyllina]